MRLSVRRRFHLFAAFVLMVSAYVTAGCERVVHLEAEDNPLIQLDAAFVSGEPVPEIRVRRTFGLTGTRPFRVNPEDLWAEDARLELRRNGSIVVLNETAPGRFAALQEAPVAAGDVFEAEVRWRDQLASATALVPAVDAEISVVVDTLRRVGEMVYRDELTGRQDTLSHFQAEVEVSAGLLNEVQLVLVTSSSELHLFGSSAPPWRLGLPYSTVYGDEIGTALLQLVRPVSVFRPASATGIGTEEIFVSVIVPQPIYGDYMRTRSDFFTPVTVTNVTGGVGLFFGAGSAFIRIEIGD